MDTRAQQAGEAEAEQVLVSLGAVLEWTESPLPEHWDNGILGRWWKASVGSSIVDTKIYIIMERPAEKKHFHPHLVGEDRDDVDNRDGFKTLQEAKASCERHNATGDWA
jgi:hypothetical protein